MRFRRNAKFISEINMTPVIDIVFQLLTFFMLTSTFIKSSAINVDLPSSKTSDAQPVREVVVVLYKDGRITVNNQPVQKNAITSFISKYAQQDSELVVTVQGDKRVDYGLLIEVMDAVRQAGVKRLSLATIYKED
ncbi:ExbD/TolR family protein [Thermospira aquatica]|uniref:Biopolymer transporter ExbD n=1 Tax=Thermospira aquatica TaxID=2828656 RepID=A0AAX3BEM8_9SPIR|nr:biopolymer transporter ExbD [Thermospira aquatica]URA10700.1 biopolymer transporter ExbD [Thermospira aquatica]